MANKTIPVSVPPAPALPKARPARVAIIHADGRRQTISLGTGCHVVGRTEGDIVLSEDSTVSRLHARIDVAANSVTVVDLGSTRGTFDDDGVKLREPRLLVARQGVRIGKTRIVLLTEPSGTSNGEQTTAETKPAIPAALRARQSLAPTTIDTGDTTGANGDKPV